MLCFEQAKTVQKKTPCIIYYKIVFASGKGCRDRWTGDKIFIPLT